MHCVPKFVPSCIVLESYIFEYIQVINGGTLENISLFFFTDEVITFLDLSSYFRNHWLGRIMVKTLLIFGMWGFPMEKYTIE